ncbi:hypothetical protein ACQWHR_26590, partial [Salmonella enterica subsp. enterica serovar Infantis]
KAFQFEREGYFCLDSRYPTADKLVVHPTVGLRDTWAKAGEYALRQQANAVKIP